MFKDYIIRIWQQVHRKRNRFEIPLLVAILGTKFPKEHFLVHKTTNLCATQNTPGNFRIHRRHILTKKLISCISVTGYFTYCQPIEYIDNYLVDYWKYHYCTFFFVNYSGKQIVFVARISVWIIVHKQQAHTFFCVETNIQ